MACAALGGVTTPSNPAYVAEELGRQLSDSSAKIVLSSRLYSETVLDAVTRRSGSEPPPLVSYVEDADCFARAPPQPSAIALPRPIEPRQDVAVLPYSSGTTGRPKGVMLSHYNLVANVLQMNSADAFARFAYGPEDTLLGLLPLFHIYGSTVLMLGSLAYQSTLVLLPRFEPAAFLSAIESHRVTVACLVPPVCLFLAKSPAVDAADLSSLRYIWSGAAPMDAAQEAAVVERLGGGVQMRQAYGMTELSPIALVSGERDHRPGSSGRLPPNTACKIVDPQTGAALPRGASGELLIRGPQVMLGYKDRPEATAECLEAVDAAGVVLGESGAAPSARADFGGLWMRTGDVACIDDEGNVTISERIKELIKCKGFQVAPAEVEGVLLEDTDIADACVLGIPHEKYGEVPKAFVTPKPGSPLDASTAASLSADARKELVMAKLRPRLTEYKWPAEVVFVDAIPKSPSGKILRRLLREHQ